MIFEVNVMTDHRKVDVAVFIHRMGVGGAEKATVNLLKGFVKRDLRVDLVVLWKEGVFLNHIPSKVRLINLDAPTNLYPYRWHRLLKFLWKRHLSSFDLDCLLKLNAISAKIAFYFCGKPTMYPAWINTMALRLANYLKENKPSALLAILPDPNIIALKARQFTRISFRLVISEHITPSVALQFSPRRQFIEQSIRTLYPKADVIVAVSQGVAEDLIQNYGVPEEKVKVIFNPVVTEELFDMALEDVSHPWFEQELSSVILAVGRLTKAKDYPTLFRAFSLVRQVRPAKLLILGEGEDRANLERLAIELGIQNDVSMPGFVDNPFAFMAKASVFVLSSAWEALPTVLIEALACGCPVVATDCRSGPREILGNGRYGRLVPVGDHEALAKAILETLDNPDFPATREERIQRALEFSLDAAVEKYLQVLLPERFGNTSRRQGNL
jgi:glycosyltransferase involved in cell wall biosynthesis